MYTQILLIPWLIKYYKYQSTDYAAMKTFVPDIIITKLSSLKIYINLWKLIYNKHIHHLVNPNKTDVIDKCNHVEKLMSHAIEKWYKVIRLKVITHSRKSINTISSPHQN